MTSEQIAKVMNNSDRVFFPFLGEDNIFTNGIKIQRVMFTVPGINFKMYWYGFFIVLGLFLAVIYGFKRMRKHGIDPDRAIDAAMVGLIGAVVGARLYFVLFKWASYKDDLTKIFNIRDGGLAIYGGIIGALLVGGIVAKIRKVNIPALFDIVGPCFLIGQAIGRWGNFFNQEAFGTVTKMPWGMTSRHIMEWLAEYTYVSEYTRADYVAHPCFLYESLWCIIGFLLLHFYMKHRKFDGEVFLMYIGWYGLGRFFIEGLRTDSLYIGEALRVSQVLAGICVLVSVILILVFRGMVRRSGEYKFYYETDESKALLAEADRQLEEYEKKRAERKSKLSVKSESNYKETEEETKLIDEEIDVTELECEEVEDDEDFEDIDDFDDIDE